MKVVTFKICFAIDDSSDENKILEIIAQNTLNDEKCNIYRKSLLTSTLEMTQK